MPKWLERSRGWTRLGAVSMTFWIYAVLGVVVLAIYIGRVWERRRGTDGGHVVQTPLGESRRTVRDLSLLFSLDSAGGGLVLTSLIALWLTRRFGFNLAQVGSTLATMSLASAVSALAAPRLVRKYGPVRTMVLTHAPAQVLLLATAFAPNATVAVVLLMLRSLSSNLDVPARTAFVMNVVTPAERAAAASFTNIPRALAAAMTPAASGWMLGRSTFGWPLIVAGVMKLTYDTLLFVRFGHVDDELVAESARVRVR